MSPFACNARYFMLTYSQCGDLDPFAVNDKFASLDAECIVARELHQIEGVHLHVFVDFGRKFRSRKTDVFDVGGFHPNIKPTRRTPTAGFDYATKDGDIVAGGLERPPAGDIGGESNHSKWTAISGASSREEFWELCRMLDPKAMVTSFPALQRFCDWQFRPEPTPYVTPAGVTFDISRYAGCDDWLQQSGVGLGQPLVGKLSCTSVRGASPPGQARSWAATQGDPCPRNLGCVLYVY